MANRDRKKGAGFLARLRRDEAGNAIAIFAAAIFPAIGLIGGGVDMSRIYLVKTRLQAACDAGSLMGRKVMADKAWNANDNRADKRAKQMFDANFNPGAYGTSDLQRSFSESSGNVTGNATVTVPMTLMKVFDQKNRVINVTCRSELRIPDTDVMFVLDVTGSMGWCADGTVPCATPNRRITGLRTAVACFYEALAKQNISQLSKEACGEDDDPEDVNEGDVRLRFGFVPYNVNVNVGKLLPHDYIADNWTYQSREAEFENSPVVDGYEAEIGTEGNYELQNRDNGNGNWTRWTDVGHGINQYPWYYNAVVNPGRWRCEWLYAPESFTEAGSSNGGYSLISTSPDPLAYPDSEITKTYRRSSGGGVEYQFRYATFYTGRRNNRRRCKLQERTRSQASVETYTTTTPVTWKPIIAGFEKTFARWRYKPTEFDVSGLKLDGSTKGWNSTVGVPLGDEGALKDVDWNGCVEERQTFKNTDGNPSDDWDPIPAAAKDLDIDLEPDAGDSTTQWGPQLPDSLYIRRLSNNSWTTDQFTSESNGYRAEQYSDRYTASCPTEASLYKTWSTNEFWGYLNTLQPQGNTYHDIGLLWGARLMSPTGIFSDINDDQDELPERHLVFMTDGDTQTSTSNYSAYGINWLDRRQNTGNPTSGQLDSIVNARTQAICKHVKTKMNTTLWVVSFGSGVGTATETALQQCASDGKYFKADDTEALVSRFKAIASSISNLRLTK